MNAHEKVLNVHNDTKESVQLGNSDVLKIKTRPVFNRLRDRTVYL